VKEKDGQKICKVVFKCNSDMRYELHIHTHGGALTGRAESAVRGSGRGWGGGCAKVEGDVNGVAGAKTRSGTVDITNFAAAIFTTAVVKASNSIASCS
jgi:formylmethanofuran dehydrogenase subunit C